MAVITAACIGAVGSVGAAGLSYAASQQGGGGGPGNPQYKAGPQDPLDKAMRSYYARMMVTNADKTAPSFAGALAHPGDESYRKLNLDMPEMTPSEAAGFGITGRHGEAIPTLSQADIDSGEMTPDQILYLAKQRKQAAMQMGQPVGQWAGSVLHTDKHLRDVQDKLDYLRGVEDPGRKVVRRLGRYERREERLTGRQQDQLNPTARG